MRHDPSNIAVRNTFFGGIRLAIGVVATICTSAIMARTLGPANMGAYSYTIWLAGTLGILANIGLPAALTKFVSEFVGRGDSATAARLAKRLLIIQFAMALGVSGATACFVVLRTPSSNIILLAAVMVLFQALLQGLTATLAGVQRFDRIAIISSYVALAQVVSVIIARSLHAGVIGMLWATLGGLLIGSWLSYRSVDRLLLKLSEPCPSSVVGMTDLYSRIRHFSLTLTYVLLLDTIIWQRSEVLFLKWYSPLPELAFYTLAYSVASKFNEVASTFSGTLLPLFSASYGRNGLRDIGPIFLNATKYVQMGIVPLCLMGVVVAKPVVRLLYGTTYLPLVLPLQILIGSLAVTCIGAVGSPLVVGTGKQGFIAVWGTFVAILNLVLDLMLIPRYGAVGAALANSTAQVIGVLGGTVYVIRYTRTSFPWRSTAAIYVAAAIAVAPAVYYHSATESGIAMRACTVTIGAILYVMILVVTGELGKRDLVILRTALLNKIPSVGPVEAADVA
jgi:O-antigen/teichoic acid export membrane protein